MLKHILSVVCVSFFVGTFPCPAQSAGPRISVVDFGAQPGGTANNDSAIRAALAKAISIGSGATVFLPAGTYRISHAIEIFGSKGLTFEGEPQTLIVMDNVDEPMLRVRDGQNLTIKQLSFDRQPLHQTQGTINAVNIDAMTCDVTLDPEYPGFDAPQFAKGGTFGPFVYPESGTYQLDRYPSIYISAASLGERRWKILFKGPKPQDQWVGKKFVFWACGRGHCLEASGLHDALFEDIHYCGGGSAGLYLGDLSGSITFRHFVIGPPAGSNRLFAECGGGQISRIRGKLLFENCDFTKIDDDGLDILGNWTRVLDQVDARTLHLQSSVGIQAGDHIQLWDWVAKASRVEAIVQGLIINTDRSVTITLDRDVTTVRVGAGDGRPFGTPANLDGIDRVIDLDDMGQQTVIRNCNFQVFRAKCLNLKAKNCLVEHCTFSGSHQPAISATPEWYFEEGPTVRHLVIRQNTFKTCNDSNIEIGPDLTPGTGPSRDTIDVLIEDNHFENYGALASVFSRYYTIGDVIRVQNAKDVIIRNNDFGQPATTAPADAPKLIVVNSDHVTIENNANLPEAKIQRINSTVAPAPPPAKDSPAKPAQD